MNLAEARAEILRILSADLDELIEGESSTVAPPIALTSWDIPVGGREAVRLYGLPGKRTDELMGVVGEFQDGLAPDLGNTAMPFYRIGSFGSAVLGAVAGLGSVFTMSTDAPTHPQLAHLEAREAELVNSGLSIFVDCAWRWHRLVGVLAEQEVAAGQAEVAAWRAAKDESERAAILDRRGAGLELSRMVYENFVGRDPEAISPDDSFWSEVILDVS
ncbi:SUKH-4 family immunity protein [Kribbella sp. NBC_01505]|uniref:SUKH-4 family immunity protein n=1 Tax=Kribbella sp. NBC_01505 TaxID=2903580 RepID=UPI0038655001